MQLTGHTSWHILHSVQLHVSMTYVLSFFKTAFSGQKRKQLSQEMQREVISKIGVIDYYYTISNQFYKVGANVSQGD